MTTPETPQTTLDWLILSLIPGLGARTLVQLSEHYCEPAHILKVLKKEHKHLPLPAKAKQWLAIYSRDIYKSLADQFDKTLHWMGHQGHLVSFDQASYPALLQQIYDPPAVLYVKGQVNRLQGCQNIAMVGSRRASKLGLSIAHRLSYQLAANGWNIVSGMALGVDAESHQGALDAYCSNTSVAEHQVASTIGVVATGLDIEYPQSNASLYQQLYESGCVVSEFPLGTKANARLFPRRNRIISGLSLGVLVVEAAIKSGSLVTTKYAAEQGREVFAVPGNINNPQAQGCHFLIQNGAKLVQGVDDVLAEFETHHVVQPLDNYQSPSPISSGQSLLFQPAQASENNSAAIKSAAAPVSQKRSIAMAVPEQHRKLMDVMAQNSTQECISADQLIVALGKTWPELSGQLLELEMLGLIKSVSGGYSLDN